MNYKQILKIIFLVSILVAGVIGYSRYFTGWGGSLYAFSVSLVPISLVLIFLKERIFLFWKKFALYWLSLSIIFICFVSEDGSGGSFGINLNFDREMMGQILAGLFFVISIVLIAWKAYQLRHK